MLRLSPTSTFLVNVFPPIDVPCAVVNDSVISPVSLTIVVLVEAEPPPCRAPPAPVLTSSILPKLEGLPDSTACDRLLTASTLSEVVL